MPFSPVHETTTRPRFQSQSECKAQSGFVVLLLAVAIAMVASLWVAAQQKGMISKYKSDQIQRDFSELERVKDRLLAFAVLQPEVYKTDSVGALQDSTQIPPLGYFPCPDLDGDGAVTGSETECSNPLLAGNNQTGFIPDPFNSSGGGACDGSGVCVGYVPERISKRNLYFAPSERYYYFLDERFTTQNNNYNTGGGSGPKRYAPLYPDRLQGDPSAASNSLDPFDPVLSWNGEDGYVALIIDAGTDGLDAANMDGDFEFESGTSTLSQSDKADHIVGISFNDWFSLVAHRLCTERRRFEGLEADYSDVGVGIQHWYNDYHASSNMGGGNWRSWGTVCP